MFLLTPRRCRLLGGQCVSLPLSGQDHPPCWSGGGGSVLFGHSWFIETIEAGFLHYLCLIYAILCLIYTLFTLTYTLWHIYATNYLVPYLCYLPYLCHMPHVWLMSCLCQKCHIYATNCIAHDLYHMWYLCLIPDLCLIICQSNYNSRSRVMKSLFQCS